jgi:hypothetical protein
MLAKREEHQFTSDDSKSKARTTNINSINPTYMENFVLAQQFAIKYCT